MFEGNKGIALRIVFGIFDESDPVDRSTKVKLFSDSLLSSRIGKSANEDSLVGVGVGDIFVFKWLP